MATTTTTTKQNNEVQSQGTGGLTLQTERGVTTVSDEVVAKLAGHACREVAGVAGMGTSFRRLLGRVRPGDALSQGVNVEVGKKEAAIDLVFIVRFGHSIPELANEVRSNVIARIEAATGLLVKEVNIEIDDMVFDDDDDTTTARVE